jgi:hypothetical protein
MFFRVAVCEISTYPVSTSDTLIGTLVGSVVAAVDLIIIWFDLLARKYKKPGRMHVPAGQGEDQSD